MSRDNPKDPRIQNQPDAGTPLKLQEQQVGEEVVDLTDSNLIVTLGPKEAQCRGWKMMSVIYTVLALAALFTLVLIGYDFGQERSEAQYLPMLERLAEQVRDQKTTIDEKDEQIASQSTVLETNQGRLERYVKQVAQLKEQLKPLDENGVRRDRMFEFYGEHDPELEPDFVLDTEFRLYCQKECPEAVLPSNEWTVESVLDSWQETPDAWGYYGGGGGRCHTFFTWTPDYEHCFILDADEPYLWKEAEEREALVSGWLVVDGIRVAMFDRETYDIEDPWELVRQYQAGEWDGGVRRSHDGSTTVELVGGRLVYHYEAYWYDEHFDPTGMAWQDFAEQPWWWEPGLSKELRQVLELPENWAPKSEIVYNQRCATWLFTKIYADLPVSSYLADDVVTTQRVDDQLFFCLKATQVQLFSKGQLLDEWDLSELSLRFDPQKATLLLGFKNPTTEYAQDVAYLRIGRKLIALREGGKLAVVLEEIEQHDNLFVSDGCFGFQAGRLMHWQLYKYKRSETLPVVVAEDVLDVDLSELVLFVKADGCYMVTYDDDYNDVVEYLGRETMQYYIDYFKRLQWSWHLAR